MNVREAARMDVSPEKLDLYLDLTAGEISRIILCLLIEEALRGRLAAFRYDLPAQPVEGFKELGVARHDVMLVGDGLG
jgi:hypothetical protein